MKKKILSVILAMILVMAYAVPVSATEAVATAPDAAPIENVDPNNAESEDPVQAAYDAFEKMAAAYVSGDYDAMKAAREDFWAAQGTFTEAQTAEWENIIVTIGQDRYDTVLTDAAWLVDFEPTYKAFAADKNANTAYEYVKSYEYMSWIDIKKFFDNADTLYTEAKALAPESENVIKIYETYTEMMYWFTNENGGVDSGWFEESFEEFEALLDVYNGLSNEEFEQLAGLLGVENGEAAYDKILGDWIVVNVAVELDAKADAFNDSYSVEDAKAFVEYYDSIIGSDMFTEEELELLIYRNTYDSVYEEALYAIENAANQETTTEAEGESEPEPADKPDKSDKDTSPATGDDFNAAPYAALMVMAAAVAALAVKRRKVQ